MPRCALLTMENLDGHIVDDELLIEPLQGRGFAVESVPWRRRDVDWGSFDAVIVRTTWDYHKDPKAFLAALEAIEESGARLENSLELIRWNISKTYLRELEQWGLPVVPTMWGRSPQAESLSELVTEHGDMVIKPVISASAEDTFHISPAMEPDTLANIAVRFDGRDYMAQPFMRGIIDEGEFSVFFFGGEYSHTVLKSPKTDDFRVQEEYGGRLLAVAPEPELLGCAEQTLGSLNPSPLYARIDLVRRDTDFSIMEVELIEPSLYLRFDAMAAQRFAIALDRVCAGTAV